MQDRAEQGPYLAAALSPCTTCEACNEKLLDATVKIFFFFELVGFAGDTLAAVQIINALDEYDTRYLTLEKVVRVLTEKARTVELQPVGVRILVGGRGRKGGFLLTSLGSDQNFEPQTQPAREGAYLIEGACSHTDIGPYLEEKVKPAAAQWKSLDDVV